MDRPLTLALAPTVGTRVVADLVRVQPLAAYLTGVLGVPVQVVVEPSYAACINGLRVGRIDSALFGEAAALLGPQLGTFEPLVAPVGPDGDVTMYQSVMFTRRETGMHDIAGLRGATVGMVDEQSASGYLMPRSMLREAGLDPDVDVHVRLYGRHRLFAEAVLGGEVNAGAAHMNAARPPTLEDAARYARLRVIATSRPIPRGPVVVRADLDADVRTRLARAFIDMHYRTPEAAAVLNVTEGQRFTLAAPRSTPTLKSIASLAGVSYATVSRVINGSGPVAPSTLERVSAIVKALGYRPNGHALTVQGQRLPIVGLVTPLRPDDESMSIANLVRPRLEQAGVPFVLCPVDATDALQHSMNPVQRHIQVPETADDLGRRDLVDRVPPVSGVRVDVGRRQEPDAVVVAQRLDAQVRSA
jgi:phosphonate transport system substrate-binding protein